jgi:hypothetical protein
MNLIKMGDRGGNVMQLQQSLNARPSKLPPLRTDSIFGPLTRARVMEFQRDNGLTPDGIVGPMTMAKLRGGGEPPDDVAELQNAMLIIANLLGPGQRQDFLIHAQAEAGPRNPNVLGAIQGAAPVVVVVVLFFLLLMMWVIVRSSPRKADQELAREWDRRLQRLKESIKDKPVEVQTAETLEEAKRRAKDVVERVKADREKCLEKFGTGTPPPLCAKALKKLSEALQSLLQKQVTRVGGGITPEKLAKGIGESIQAVFDAAKEVSDKCGCDI